MNLIQQECRDRRITRLCHFTQSRNLPHIFGDSYGLYSTRTLKNQKMPHNPTDTNRYDGRDDLVCCSLEYPNTFYFIKVRSSDPLFKDWAVLLIDRSYLWHSETHFCPCNAARDRGGYIQKGIKGFRSLFKNISPGRNISRSPSHLPSAPTDIQAEVLVKDPINLEVITGIAVQTKEQAQREVCRLNLQGISMDKPIYIIPDFFDREKLSRLIRRGSRAKEKLYGGGHHVQ